MSVVCEWLRRRRRSGRGKGIEAAVVEIWDGMGWDSGVVYVLLQNSSMRSPDLKPQI